MNKCTQLGSYLTELFGNEKIVKKVKGMIDGLWKAQSCRMSEIARAMGGSEEANCKCIQRFLGVADLKSVLLRFYQEDAPFMIGDPTEILDQRPGKRSMWGR